MMRLDLLLVLALAAIVPSAGYRFFRSDGLHATRPVHIRRSRAQRAEYPSSVLLAVKETTDLSPIVSSNDPFWYQGLNFSCTGCGRCCQNEGEVWLNTEEFYQVSNHLGLSYTDFIDFYVETVRSGWVMLKSNKAPATQRISPSISTPSAVGSESSLSDSKTIEASQPGGIQKIENEQCIFLAEDGKQCTIYNVRPTQCRTYPYWPSLLSSRVNWLEERVLPESIDIVPPTNEALSSKEEIVEGGNGGDGRNGGSGELQLAVDKYWSVEDGGCEGIEHFESSMLVDRNTIHRNCMQYTMYHDEFPFMTAGEDASRLLAKAGAIERVNRATQAWVQDFVIGYNLCPFAESVFSAGQVRYKVYLGSRSEEDIIERIKYEVYALLNAKPEDAETTLLMLPFAFPTFEEFYDFSVRMEDIYLPQIERETRIVLSSSSDSSSGSSSSNAMGSRRSLKDVLSKKQASGETKGASDGSSSKDSEPEIKLAFFHPGFRWADESGDEEGEGQLEGEEGDREEEGKELDSVPASAFGSASGLLSTAAGGSAFNRPLNFEKRAPFPTINLLRAKTIRDFANQRKTSAIASGNRSSLEEAGSEQLVAAFNRIMQLAIDG